jgi:hypothetical protein
MGSLRAGDMQATTADSDAGSASAGIRRGPLLAALAALLALWLGAMAAVLAAAEGEDARAGELLALLPPGDRGEVGAIAAAAAAGGVMMRGTIFPGLYAVYGEGEGFAGRLRAAGASRVWPPDLLDALSLGGCSWAPPGRPRTPAEVAKLRAGPM